MKKSNVETVSVKSERDGLGYDISIVFAIKGSDQAVTFTTFLETNRG